MAIPPTAKVFKQALDPSDVLDFYIGLTQGSDDDDLQVGEDVASFTLTLGTEAIAAGLVLMDVGNYRTRMADKVIGFWLSATPAAEVAVIYNGSGIQLPIVLTYTTNSVPARTVQRTVVVTGKNQ